MIEKEREKIGKAIRDEMEKQNFSLRSLGKKVGYKHGQILRITNGKNYNIETLLRVLEGLDMEIKIKKKDR